MLKPDYMGGLDRSQRDHLQALKDELLRVAHSTPHQYNKQKRIPTQQPISLFLIPGKRQEAFSFR